MLNHIGGIKEIDKMNTKFQDIVSKVTFHSDTPEDIAQEILIWVKKAKPIVIQKNKPFNKGE